MADIPDLAKTELAIVQHTNAFRKEEGLGPVRRNPALDQAARSFARYLATSGKFAHEADGRTPAKRASAAGYRYCNIAENLAFHRDRRGFTVERLARETMEGWKKSPGHRKNLMLSRVTEIGVGVARAPAGNPTFLSVQMLGRPSSLSFQFAVTNKSKTAVAYTFAGKSHDIPPHAVITHKTCEPGRLVFKQTGGWFFGQKLTASFTVSGKAAFVIQEGRDGKVHVTEGKK